MVALRTLGPVCAAIGTGVLWSLVDDEFFRVHERAANSIVDMLQAIGISATTDVRWNTGVMSGVILALIIGAVFGIVLALFVRKHILLYWVVFWMTANLTEFALGRLSGLSMPLIISRPEVWVQFVASLAVWSPLARHVSRSQRGTGRHNFSAYGDK